MITRKITADKEGMINHLEAEKVAKLEQAENKEITQKRRANLKGQAQGLEFAIHALRDWEIESK